MMTGINDEMLKKARITSFNGLKAFSVSIDGRNEEYVLAHDEKEAKNMYLEYIEKMVSAVDLDILLGKSEGIKERARMIASIKAKMKGIDNG